MSFKEKLLKFSGSYNYYKNEYKKLKKENKNLNRKISKLEQKFDKRNKLYMDTQRLLDHKAEEFKKLEKYVNETSKYNTSINEELRYAFIFNDSIKDSEWLKYKNFSLNNAAANYSFVYALFRILNDIQPTNILELGLGQTTKLTTQFVHYYKDSKLMVIEGDSDWINIFSESLIMEANIKIINNDLELFKYEDTESLRFKDFKNVVHDEKFDLIIIDGPQGFIVDENNKNREFIYSRTNIWDLIPNNLSDEFVIIVDDYNRIGEQNTVKHLKKLLKDNDIVFYEYVIKGYKAQCIIFTEQYKFIGWI